MTLQNSLARIQRPLGSVQGRVNVSHSLAQDIRGLEFNWSRVFAKRLALINVKEFGSDSEVAESKRGYENAIPPPPPPPPPPPAV